MVKRARLTCLLPVFIAGCIAVLTGCGPPVGTALEYDSDLLEKLSAVAERELSLSGIQGLITLSHTDTTPRSVLDKFPEFENGTVDIAFTIHTREDFELVVDSDDAPVWRLQCKDGMLVLSGDPVGNWPELTNEKPGLDEALWLYFIVAEHLFPLTATPSFDLPAFRYILQRGGIADCGETGSIFPEDENSNAEQSRICAEFDIGGVQVKRYGLSPENDLISRFQSSINNALTQDLQYSTSLAFDNDQENALLPRECKRVLSPLGKLISTLQRVERITE